LIYFNLTDCKNEFLISNDEINVLKQEIVVIKKENNVKNENRILKAKSKHIDICASSGIAVAKHEPVQIQLKKEVNNIECLKEKLRNALTLNGKVSLANDDKVLIIKCNKLNIGFYNGNLSACYKENDLQHMFHIFDLKDAEGLMRELLNKVKYHLYGHKIDGYQYYRFVFPLDLHNIKDIKVEVPDIFKIEIVNNELMVEILKQCTVPRYVLIEKYKFGFKHGQKINLQQLDDSDRITDPFAPGYAFLFFHYR